MSNNPSPDIPPHPDEINGLVHHFIERYDLWQADGCAAAREYLLTCYARIDGHYEQLRAWAEHMEQARQLAASFMQSSAYHDLVLRAFLI
ncbi:hypothetical protein [Verminephrobacter eiseniae]|uniref:Uncharacterized protein n=1 Tax=Verminephrobacter eiseniae (strain EF01-2) TaxID=391735 RepID=A1WLC7_VEREI|nr:hypothetical protein [Verminephrobacter eiseniae]ABM58434.1 hypothetical protein Veis_2692 [Verminephrobacter eiseniae EF01-2]MCW5284011.1 hypothetical protein [Verminephrobacter eiseniae]MCW5301719.1 hypothetical protein [Verminephrobacter eiseniae]MCW8180840.1 hypothetical protein [Verminephrobacter eiseniae]MCW8190379.1 hypothetical protein [Verminephrobacter eiseniae]